MCAKWHLSYRNSDLDEDGRGITVIRARGLTKIFNTRRGREMIPVTTVDHIDLDVAEGEVIGFLGPNGAGKTTTLRMLTTLLQPTSGEAKVAGHDISTNPRDVRRRIGYVSQGGSTSSFARVGDEIVDHAMLYGLDAGTARVRAQELLERLDLPGVWTRTPRTLSGGQRRRLNLAMGLVHHPKLAFLDEPTAGLDPQARANLWSHIADMRRKHGMTVFLTTHYLEEADILSDRIVVLDRGRIIASDTPSNLKAQVPGDLVEIELSNASDVSATAERMANLTGNDVEIDRLHVVGRVPHAGRAVPQLVRDLHELGIDIASMEVRHPTLDDVFLTLTGRSLRDGE
jgi:ABC-2 type transport system ATP-binding protein